MTYNATVEPILRGTGIFATFWVVLSILVTIVISTCTKKDTAADRCGHVQYVLVVGSCFDWRTNVMPAVLVKTRPPCPPI